jgi:hypothetical protein
MSRYHTIDTYTGEVVHQSNRHPALQPLTRKPQGRVSRPKSFQSQGRHHVQVDPLVVVIIASIALIVMLNFGY